MAKNRQKCRKKQKFLKPSKMAKHRQICPKRKKCLKTVKKTLKNVEKQLKI